MKPILLSSQPQLTQLPPLSLYVHFPWCIQKCPYCDFNSHAVRSGFDEEAYIAALLIDIEQALPAIWGRAIHSLFIGGGTPSLMSPSSLQHLLEGIRARLRLMPALEITLEANPGTFEADKFAAFSQQGVNRLSIGVQSFDDQRLKVLGRVHDSQQAHRAIETALRTFERVNLDLMYALPGQTLAQAQQDMQIAIASGVSHISAYHLTLEPNTWFARYPPTGLPDDDLAADMQEALEAQLARAGFEHYETSAFARQGQRCQHNLNYWLFGDYLGIGAGAHSKLSSATDIVREMRYKQPQAYLEAIKAGSAVQTRNSISAKQRPFEFMMNTLRLIDGFELSLFNERTGLNPLVLHQALQQAERLGLVEQSLTELKPSLHGQRFLNDLLGLFLEE